MSHLLSSTRNFPLKHLILPWGAAIVLCLWLCILLHIPLYNVGGGEGVQLPWNILAWAVAVTVILMTAVMMPGRDPVVTPAAKLLFLAILLMSLPVLWCPAWDWVIYSLPRLSGLWGGAIFYFALLQCRFSHPTKRLFLWCITFAALVQGGAVIVGLFCPTLLSPLSQTFLRAGGRESLGIFQQVNVTASFIATGFALSMALFYQLGLRRAAGDNRVPVSLLCMTQSAYLLVPMVLLPCVLVLTQSRTGWLGGLTVYLVAAATVIFAAKRRGGRLRCLPWEYSTAVVLMPLVGIVLGLRLIDTSISHAIAHDGSNYQRWLTLKVTWEMIKLQPWTGWGIGSFIMQFQHYIASHYTPNPSQAFMGHPHNEVLYVWMEGGVVALAGLIVMGCIVVMLFLKNRSPVRRLLAMAMLPILIHTMLEYPLYLSTPHVMTLLLIVISLDRYGLARCGSQVKIPDSVRKNRGVCLRGLAVVTCVWMLTCLYASFHVNAMLSHFETDDGSHPLSLTRTEVPWLLMSRYDKDLMNIKLEAYNRNGDLRLLREVVNMNARWLKNNVDSDRYAGQVEVLRYLHRNEEACEYQQEGHQIFPQDEQFNENYCR